MTDLPYCFVCQQERPIPPNGCGKHCEEPMIKTKRLLVTGSREWTDKATIAKALGQVWEAWGTPGDAMLVHGACHLGGADIIAEEVWRSWCLPTEGHPAKRDTNGKVLGPARNAKMVNLGADVCLAFPLPGSRGTINCMNLAKKAGIEVRVWNPGATTWEQY